MFSGILVFLQTLSTKQEYMINTRMIESLKKKLVIKVLKYFFEGVILKKHLCSEMHFLREQLFWTLWLLVNLAAALYFLSKFSPEVVYHHILKSLIKALC